MTGCKLVDALVKVKDDGDKYNEGDRKKVCSQKFSDYIPIDTGNETPIRPLFIVFWLGMSPEFNFYSLHRHFVVKALL